MPRCELNNFDLIMQVHRRFHDLKLQLMHWTRTNFNQFYILELNQNEAILDKKPLFSLPSSHISHRPLQRRAGPNFGLFTPGRGSNMDRSCGSWHDFLKHLELFQVVKMSSTHCEISSILLYHSSRSSSSCRKQSGIQL